jgi:hypothetical protein
MLIIKETLVQFDELAERARLDTAFNGATRNTLIKLLDQFVAGDWGGCLRILRSMSREELEYVHIDVFDMLKELSHRNLLLEAHLDRPGPPDATEKFLQLHYPQFQAGLSLGELRSVTMEFGSRLPPSI